MVPPGWGRLPFLAVPDTSDYNLPRFEGSWGEAGNRLTEHARGWPAGYYLWCWENPHPDRAVERIEFIPRGPRFIVAGITTSDVDEHPFVRTPARPVRLVAKDGRGGVFDVNVDRGVATYPQPLPGEDDRAGWGATEGTAAYTSIAALPSATIAVRRDGDELGRVRWGDVARDGRADAGRVTLELAESGRNWVHVSVVDDATGRPVPCRVHFRSAEGIPYQPHGHHNHVTQNLDSWHYDVGGDVRLGQRSYAYIDGTCQGWLPRGDVVVDVARGFEYEPLRQTVRIEPGQRDLTLRIRRVADMAAEGWWSGDSHVHFLSTPGAQLEQRGEDLRVVNVLQTQWGVLFTNTEEFSGQPSVVDGGGYVTYIGQENRQHVLGHVLLWGLKEPVMPWCSDGPDEAELGGALDATLSDWADRTHAQGGTVVAAHFPNPNGEPAVLVATGRADAVEMLAQVRRRDARVLPVPEQRLPAAARRRHGQDVKRRAGRPVPHVRAAGRGVQLRGLVPGGAVGPYVPVRRPAGDALGRWVRAGRYRRAFRAGNGQRPCHGAQYLPAPLPRSRPQRRGRRAMQTPTAACRPKSARNCGSTATRG